MSNAAAMIATLVVKQVLALRAPSYHAVSMSTNAVASTHLHTRSHLPRAKAREMQQDIEQHVALPCARCRIDRYFFITYAQNGWHTQRVQGYL